MARTSGRHDDGACDNGAREGAPSDFVDTGDQRTGRLPEITLDRRPPIASTDSRAALLGRARFWNSDVRLLFADARRLAGEVAQVVELGATDASPAT